MPEGGDKTVSQCPRCIGGSMVLSYGEESCLACGWYPVPEPPPEVAEGWHMKERNTLHNRLTPAGREARNLRLEKMARDKVPIYLVADREGISIPWAKKQMTEARRRVK